MNEWIVYRSRSEKVSLHVRRRALLTIAILAAALAVLVVLCIGIGRTWTNPWESFKVIFGHGTTEQWLVIGVLRLPRIILAVLVGAALAVTGAILQGMIRNPLASPDLIGITGGASFAAVAFITYLGGSLSIRWLPAAAFVGAGLVSVIIYILAWNKGVTPTRLVLIGIGVSAAVNALTTLMIVVSPISSAGQAYIWITGSIYGASWDNVQSLLPWVVVLLPLALVYARHVSVQELGDDVSRGLGARIQMQRIALLAICVLLAGAAVSVAGAVGFVGLIAPHIARRLVGSSFGSLIPTAALIGSMMVLAADTLARTVFLPLDIPVGVFTAAVGAPFFIYLLYRNRNR